MRRRLVRVWRQLALASWIECERAHVLVWWPDCARAVQVGWVQRERKDWRRPEDVTEFEGLNVDVGVLGLDESPSDLAGQVSAAITAGALALREYDVVDRATASSMVRHCRRLQPCGLGGACGETTCWATDSRGTPAALSQHKLLSEPPPPCTSPLAQAPAAPPL